VIALHHEFERKLTPSPDLGERICVRNEIPDSEQMKPTSTNVQPAELCERGANPRQGWDEVVIVFY